MCYEGIMMKSGVKSVSIESDGSLETSGEITSISYGIATTPFGDALIGWNRHQVCHLTFCDNEAELHVKQLSGRWPLATLARNDSLAANISRQVFSDQLKSANPPLLLQGTNFQLKVWRTLLQTEPAVTLSYSQLARMVGSPRAQRAVGSALAANSVAFLIPCHRIIRKNGTPGNYRWGNKRKLAILAWELERSA